MTTATAAVNRFEKFHHHRHEHPGFYYRFETAALKVLARDQRAWHSRAFEDTLINEFDNVRTVLPDGTNVYKAMLCWLRRNHKALVDGRFNTRRTEKSRAKSSGIDWDTRAVINLDWTTQIQPLVDRCALYRRVTNVTLLKNALGIRFNQNYNAAVLRLIRSYRPDLCQYLPSRTLGAR
jgi:hypothetical protein